MKGKDCKRASGGKVKSYTADDPNVEKEAEERKRGGAVKKKEHKVEGGKAKMRMDRPARKDGGRVGADKNPFSSAHKVTMTRDHKTDD